MKQLVLQDQLGRELSLSKTPKRIVSLNPSQTETLIALGLEESLVGVTKFCVHPGHLRKTKKVVGGTKKVSFEKIRALQPDIVLCNKEENTQEMVVSLEKEFPVHVTDVVTLDDALEMITQYGHLFNCNERAKALCDRIAVKKEQHDAFISERKRYRIAYLIWKEPIMVVGRNTFIDHMLQLNGFDNAFGHLGRYPQITWEDLNRVAIDMVLLSSEPFPFNKEHKADFQKKLLGKRIELVDGEFFSWYGSRLVTAFDYFAKLPIK